MECTATIVKGPERLGFTSCLSGTGFAAVRIEERRTSEEKTLSEGMLIRNRTAILQWILRPEKEIRSQERRVLAKEMSNHLWTKLGA